MSAGLAASTVTPGSTAPEVSLTTPLMLPVACCAHVAPGVTRRNHANTTGAMPRMFIIPS